MEIQDFEYKQVIVVRQDLKLPCGKLAVQVAHASLAAAFTVKKKNPSLFEKWFNEGGKKVVVKIQDLNSLLALKKRCEEAGLITFLVRDAGKTVVNPGTVTALAIGPDRAEHLDPFTSELKLL